MATSYITYDEYLTRAKKQAEEQQTAYVTAREEQAAQTVKDLATAESASRTQIQQETDAKITQAKASYQSLYDENAVREKAAQLNVAETLANMGLSDSGLSRTQQAALSATRARSDAEVSLKKQQAVDTLLNEMTAAIEKNRETLHAAQTAEWAAAKEDEEAHRVQLEEEAQKSAQTQFAADLEAAEQQYEQEMQNKEFAQEVKEWEAEVALQKQKQSDATALEKLKQSNSLALQKQKQSDSTALEKLKQSNSLALQKQKQSDSTALQKQKQSDATALQSQKAASSTASSSSSTSSSGKLTAAQKVNLAESLRKAISERSEIYEATLRKHYDDLIAYYEKQLY